MDKRNKLTFNSLNIYKKYLRRNPTTTEVIANEKTIELLKRLIQQRTFVPTGWHLTGEIFGVPITNNEMLLDEIMLIRYSDGSLKVFKIERNRSQAASRRR